MITYVIGHVLDIEEQKAHILPRGSWVGYEILVTNLALSNARVWEEMELYIHHHITDVSEVLFGFFSREERMVFRKLLKVSWVGGKTALALLGIGMIPLVRAIEEGDEKVLGSVSGVGKKTALKIIVELKKEITSEELMAEGAVQVPLAPALHTEIIDTLVGMGYDKKTVEKVLAIMPEDLPDISAKVVWCIRSLAMR